MSEQSKSGWGLTRNLRGVRKVTDAQRKENALPWERGWTDIKGFVPEGCLFDVRDDAIKVARRRANAALKKAEKSVANAKRDLAKLDKLAAQPE